VSEGRAKLVCTVGPASVDRLDDLLSAGMDVARVNFSHGTDASQAHAIRAARAAEARAGRPLAVLVDLPGPKIRLGMLGVEELALEAGGRFVLRPRDASPGDASGAHVSYQRLADDLRPGDRVLLADGAVELRVVSSDGEVETEVVRGGVLRAHGGVSVPSGRLSQPALTTGDRADAPRAVALGADYVAQSFVRRASDVADLRALLGPGAPPIVAKIETRPAVDAFDEICGVADAVMVARGDLGVELPYEEVPILQKQLVRHALERGVPTIVATQMLESMTSSPRPTRAEASDVANAIFDGADAVMLSAETAIGAYPVLAAEAAARIAQLCEERGAPYLPSSRPSPARTDAEALAYAAVALAGASPEVGAIACYTRSGRSARILSALRPRVPILAFSPVTAVVRRLALVHGVTPRHCDPIEVGGGRLDLLGEMVRSSGAVVRGAAVVLVASTAPPGSGPNVLEVQRPPS